MQSLTRKSSQPSDNLTALNDYRLRGLVLGLKCALWDETGHWQCFVDLID